LLAAPAVFSQTAGAGNAAGTPAEIIAACGQAEADDAIGVQELEPFCPGIEHALVESGYAAFISEDQLDGLTPYSLVDLQHLTQHYDSSDALSIQAPDTSKLGAIMQSLQSPAQAQLAPGMFERFKRWLRKAFEQQQSNPGSWLNRWLPDLTVSQAVSKILGYVLVGLVIVFAIVVLINELRVAGLLRRDRRSRRNLEGAYPTSNFAAAAVSDLDAAPLRDRPSILLRMLVTTLVNTGRLRTERSLTHRELGGRASLDEPAQRECFQQVAALGERAVYGGGGSLPEAEIEKVVEAGRLLNAQLLSAAESA
jgi:hypothetical protein